MEREIGDQVSGADSVVTDTVGSLTEPIEENAASTSASGTAGNSSFAQKQKNRPTDISVPHQRSTPRTNLEPSSPPRSSLAQASAAARRSSSPFAGSASPSRVMRSSSPRHLSPATSQIFERDVQEQTGAAELSPAIPAHIQTEDHIPPVLEASSLAITDDHLNPDDVEIVMHSAHQPAAVVTGSVQESHSPLPPGPGHVSLDQQLAVPHSEYVDTGSTYGAVDPMDPRRLSFVSFADVVHAEHAEPRAESIGGNRSPSPVHSPASLDRAPMSPPTSIPGLDVSPSRTGAASPGSLAGTQHGELTIETMRQTLEKTGNSNDGQGGTSSLPLSASSNDDGRAPRSFR